MIPTINSISIHNLLPKVFTGEENSVQIQGSDIWLKENAFEKGKRYLISAPSGAGKSSFCSYIACTRRDYIGKITYNDTDIATFKMNDICNIRTKAISYMTQNISLFPELTIMENIILKNRLTGFKSESEIRNMMEVLGIVQFSSRLAAHCSIGQQQRAQIITVLCQPFEFLIMDEPVSHLDEDNNTTAAKLISEELDRQGAGLITTSVGNSLNITNAIHLNL